MKKEDNNINAYITTKGKEEKNKCSFKVDTIIPKECEWNSKEAQKFRKQFKDCEIDKGRSPEHALENKLLYEFSKSTRKQNKQLCNIQPVRLGGYFFQMATPFSASRKELKYLPSYNGGGIDILARIKTKHNECKLVIFELKDENKASEPPQKVIMQAITYAAFMSHLLADKEQGEKWWKLFGFKKKPDKIKLIASTLMPLSENNNLNSFGCEGEVLNVAENVDIELHSLFYDEQNNTFSGSLKSIMME